MSEQPITTKAGLMAEIERAWSALNAGLDRLSESQMATIKDAEGWAVKDHLIHLAAWERSAVFFLQGKPRHKGIEVDRALYDDGDDYAINAAVYQKYKDLPPADALKRLRDVHRQLMTLLQPLSDADLQKPYRDYLPDESDLDDRAAIDVVYGNSAYHFMEHLGWIEELAGDG
jgi:hypothetical protein